MSKTAARLKLVKSQLDKIDHSSKLQTYIPAGLASPSPPLGPQLGQRNINITNFIKDFNTKTAHIKEGIPIPCRVKVHPNRSYELVTYHPPVSYYLKQAAGIEKGSKLRREVAGKITIKHLYEIAKIKSQDGANILLTLEQLTQNLVGTARTCGIQIVRHLDVDKYSEFLKNRAIVVAAQKKALQDAKEAKLLRKK